MKQNLRGPSLISAFPQYGVPLDWGFSMTSENRCVGAEDPGLVICHVCWPHTGSRVDDPWRFSPHTLSLPDQVGVPLAVWATETNKKHF